MTLHGGMPYRFTLGMVSGLLVALVGSSVGYMVWPAEVEAWLLDEFDPAFPVTERIRDVGDYGDAVEFAGLAAEKGWAFVAMDIEMWSGYDVVLRCGAPHKEADA